MNHRCGFSLLEIILSIGIFALIIPTFFALFYAQNNFANKHKNLIEQIEVINDFCSFVEISNFDYINKLAKQNSTLHVIENDEDGIVSRNFVPKDIWEHSDISKKECYLIKIEPIKNLFADNTMQMKPYLPLMCKLSKIDKHSDTNPENNYCTFVTVKNY